MTDIHRFYDQVGKFKDVLSNILIIHEKTDEYNELIHYYEQLVLLKKINMRKPVEIFYDKGVKPYISQIVNKDDYFFIKEAEKKIEETEENNKKQTELTILEHIKCVWNIIDSEKKDAIWKYVRIICILSERVSGNDALINAFKK